METGLILIIWLPSLEIKERIYLMPYSVGSQVHWTGGCESKTKHMQTKAYAKTPTGTRARRDAHTVLRYSTIQSTPCHYPVCMSLFFFFQMNICKDDWKTRVSIVIVRSIHTAQKREQHEEKKNEINWVQKTSKQLWLFSFFIRRGC